MLKFVIEIAVAIWLTSSLFMLYFWLIANISTYTTHKKFLLMPISTFIYVHFCPIVHTIRCFKIMRRYAELKAKRGM